MTSPNKATASSEATRDAALLMPDAAPENLASTEFITVVVSGATLIDMPRPRTTTGGKK
jgi:hypothetical protein